MRYTVITSLIVLLSCGYKIQGLKGRVNKIIGLDHFDSDETTISTGIHLVCAIVSDESNRSKVEFQMDGSVVCWGELPYGLETHAHPLHDGFVQVVCGRVSCCGLHRTRKVSCWGHANSPKPSQFETFVQLSAGTDHMCGLRLDGSIRCWGRNSDGESSPPRGSYVQVSCGKTHCCAIDSDGLAVCWGRQSRKGETSPPEGVRFKQISASFDDHNCGIEDSPEEDSSYSSSGQVHCWGNNRLGQSSPPEGKFYSVTTGRSYSCGIRAPSREIQCWGKLKRFSNKDRWSEISAGHSTLCGITIDTHRVHCFHAIGMGRSTYADETRMLVPLIGSVSLP